MSERNPAKTISVAQFVELTEAEGPGRRCALWFQGCPLQCRGCCNPEMLPFEGGSEWTIGKVRSTLGEAKRQNNLEGVTLLGGEPFAHAEAACLIADVAEELGLTTMVFSGYRYEELLQANDPWVGRLLNRIDLLVDGRFEQEQATTTRRWIGSENQTVHFLSDRYSPEDACWNAPNQVEIRLKDGEIQVSGFPTPETSRVFRRLSGEGRTA